MGVAPRAAVGRFGGVARNGPGRRRVPSGKACAPGRSFQHFLSFGDQPEILILVGRSRPITASCVRNQRVHTIVHGPFSGGPLGRCTGRTVGRGRSAVPEAMRIDVVAGRYSRTASEGGVRPDAGRGVAGPIIKSARHLRSGRDGRRLAGTECETLPGLIGIADSPPMVAAAALRGSGRYPVAIDRRSIVATCRRRFPGARTCGGSRAKGAQKIVVGAMSLWIFSAQDALL